MVSFINNVLKLVSGSVIAQTIGILLIPIVARLYTPADFGIFQLFMSITSILAILSCFAYQLSIMLPEKDEDAANIVVLCIGLITLTSIICGIILIVFGNQVSFFLNAPEIVDYMVFAPFVIFLNGLFFVLNYWLSRRVKFGSVAIARVTNTVATKSFQIGIGSIKASAFGLIGGTIAGYLFSNLIMLKEVWKNISPFKNISIVKIKQLAIRYKKFPLYNSWSSVANTFSLQIAPFMLASSFSVAVVGQYSMANQLVSIPIGLIGGAVGQVFFQKASEEMNKSGSVKNIVREVYNRLMSIGLFPMIVLMIIGENLFAIVLGPNWVTAGIYAKILVPWLFLVFIASPLSTIFSVLERQGISLLFNVMILLSRIVVLYVGAIIGGPISTLILYSITGMIFFGWMNCYILKIAEVEKKYIIKKFLQYFLYSLVICVPLILTKYFKLNLEILFIVAILSTLVYYSFIVLKDEILSKELFRIFREN